MLIWIALFLLVGLLAVIGYYQGAIRALLLLIGSAIAAFAAWPLSPLIQPILPKIGVVSPTLFWLLPPVIIFIIILGVFIGLGFFVHKKAELFYKYRADDFHRLRWENMNRQLGICVGAVTGLGYLILLSVIVYILGYGTVQVAAEENDPAYIKLLTQARMDLHETGFDKVAAAFDPGTERYYRAMDILGLIYQNPIIHNRLSNYPPFITWRDRPQFQQLASDTSAMNKLQTKASIAEIIAEPQIRSLLRDKSLIADIQNLDLKDLYEYLRTGKSPAYFDLKILGRWRLDPDAFVTYLRRQKPNIRAAELIALKRLADYLAGLTFVATIDRQATLSFTPPANSAPPPPAPSTAVDARYGTPQRPGTPATTPAASNVPQGLEQLQLSGQGTWEKVGDHYRVTLTGSKGEKQEYTVTADGFELVATGAGQSLVFLREE